MQNSDQKKLVYKRLLKIVGEVGLDYVKTLHVCSFHYFVIFQNSIIHT